MQIAIYLESHREGSWYADPASAPAASAEGAVHRSAKRARGDDSSTGGQYRSLGAGADEEEAPKYTSLSAGFDDDAWAFPDDAPQPRRMGALDGPIKL